MTTCRISLLAVLTTVLICALVRGQPPYPSSRNYSAGEPQSITLQQESERSLLSSRKTAAAQASQPAESSSRVGWLHRLVLGEPDKSDSDLLNPSSSQSSFRESSGQPTQLGTASSLAAQPATSAESAASDSQSSASHSGAGWLRQFVWGQSNPTDSSSNSAATIERPVDPAPATAPTSATGFTSSRAGVAAAASPTAHGNELQEPVKSDGASWLRRLVWGNSSESERTPTADSSALSGTATKNPPRWSLANAFGHEGSSAGAAAPQLPTQPLPELATSSRQAQRGDSSRNIETNSGGATELDSHSASLIDWLSRFQRRGKDESNASGGLAANSTADSSRKSRTDVAVGAPGPAPIQSGQLAPSQAQPLATSPPNELNFSPPPGPSAASLSSLLGDASSRPMQGPVDPRESLQNPATALQSQVPNVSDAAVGVMESSRSPRRLPPPAAAVQDVYPRLAVAAKAPSRLPPTSRISSAVSVQSEVAEAQWSEHGDAQAAPGMPAESPFGEAPPLRKPGEGFAAGPVQPPVMQAALPTTTNPYVRPKILFRPIAMGRDANGQALLRPDAQVINDGPDAAGMPPSTLPPAYARAGSSPELSQTEDLPLSGGIPDGNDPLEQEWMPMAAEDAPYVDMGPWRSCWYRLLANLNGPRSCPTGIGTEHVMNAPFWLETTQPLNNCRIRGDAAADWEYPDRLEYFWSKTPGPKGAQPGAPLGGEPEVDYQEVSFYIERGGDRFSMGTELPIRAVDPEDRLNSTGFGDMSVTAKTVLLDGRDWQLSQIFITHLPTGSHRRGIGNGHVSLEPGVAWRYKWSDVTYFHGDLTYWFPIAGDLEWAGQFLNYGIGISHVLYDCDTFAVMPTFEINAWTLLDGRETLPRSVASNEIDTLGILNLHPGLRIVCDTCGDCGVREFGISSGISVTQEHWYEEIIRLEVRWVH